ncbi:MAG: hypothetical protein KGJ60_02710 [Verrucomicrobiota bacterium]|nr:hypothetical protein [Verrucomicrobiota bacterium]
MRNSRRNVIRQTSALHEQLEDLDDYLDLLEARARNKGKRTYRMGEVRKELELA